MSKIIFTELGTKPPAPSVGQVELYVKTDEIVYIQGSDGVEIPLGSSAAITALTGDVSATGPGSVPATIEAIQGNAVSGTTGTGNVVFSASPTLTGTLNAGSAVFTGTISASNFTGSSSGSNTGDVTVTNTNSIDLAFSSGQTGLNATLNLSSAGPDAGYIPALSQIKSDGLLVEVLAGVPVQIGTSNNIGSAASAARSDHVHAITAPIVLGLDLTGYTTGTNTPINATDTLLQAFENLQAQVSAGSSTAITSLTGDVSASGPGSAVATVNFVGGESAANVASATAAYLSATSTNTPSKLVLRDSSGNFASNIISMNVLDLLGSTSGTLTVAAPSTFTSYALTMPTSAGLANQALTTDGTGILSWSSALTTSLANGEIFVGSVSNIATPQTPTGDVTMTNSGAFTVQKIQGSAISTTAPTDAQILIYNSGSTKWIPTSLSGDATLSDTGVLTLATVNSNTGTFGSSTAIPSFTVNGKGLITAVTTDAVIAPAGTLTGTTLASNVVNSSLTSVGTITSGVWNGTALTAPYMLALPTADIYVGNGSNQPAAVALSGDATLSSSGVITLSSTAVTGKLLTGYTTGTNTPIIATNSILTAFENLQAQINSTVGSAITSLTGDVTATGPGAAASTVIALQGHSISNTAPTDAQILIYNSGTSKWTPESISGDINITDLGASTIQPNVVSNSKLAQMGANTVKANVTGSTANASDVSLGTVTESTSAVLTLTGWADATIGSPTIQVKQATTSQSGYLSSTDWNTFNNKQPAGSYITALTGQVTASGPGSAAATIATNTVTNSNLSQMPADTLKGNNTGSTANASDLTVSQVNTMLGTVTTIGTYDSQASQANGLDIVGNTLYAQSANVTNPGMVNTTTQSFAGNKTFTGTVAITPASTSALVIDTTAFVFDSTNDVLGIGLQPSTSVMIDGINTTGASKLVQMTGYGVGSTTGYRGRFARGTSSSPSAVQSGDILNALSGRGYGASQFAPASTGVVNIVAGETFTNTSNLTYLQFSTTPTGSITSAEAMRVASTGVTLGPQSSSTAIHSVNGGLSSTTNTVTASTYTMDSITTDYIVYTDSTSNAITLTLPAPTIGRTIIVQDKSGKANVNNITIDPHASEKINGITSFIISQSLGSARITCDGTNWFIQDIAPNIASTIPSVVALTETAGATTINWAASNMFTLTLNANLTISFSNQTAGQTIVVRLTNTASNYTVTWPTIKWPVQTTPIMTTGAFSDVYTLIYDGTNTYGSYVQNF